MKRYVLGLWLMAAAALNAQTIAVVSAAGYGNLVSPDSLVSVFGANLAQTASAQLDSKGQLPTSLGGVTVEVNGVAAGLVYTSANQINLYLPPEVPVGGAAVVVRSAGGTIARGQADVRSVAPALFAADGSGRGPAAVQNAVTYAPPPFLVETPQIQGDDKRTRLVLYGTGFRAAATGQQVIRALGKLASGQTVDIPVEFPVEYAGPTPGFFGLDQLNLVLPPEVDGAGVVTLTLFLGELASNQVTFTVASLPADQIQIASLTLASASVTGGQAVSGTVTLNAPARLNSYAVNVRTDSNNVQVPVSVTVPAGQTSARFDLRTTPVSAVQTAHIIASTGVLTRTATLRLDPANAALLADVRLSSSQVTGGGTVTGTVALSTTSPLGGTVVTLKTDNPSVQVPASVTVPSAQSTATFTITTTAVTAATPVTITATSGDISKTVVLTVNPPLALNFSNSTVAGGTTVNGTITLGQVAPVGGTVVTLRSNNSAAQVPGVVTVPAQQTSVSFSFPTTTVIQQQTITVTASLNNQSTTATLTLTPATSTTLSSVTVSPATVKGGVTASGTVTLSAPAPAGGLVVSLQSSNLAAQPPVSVTIAPGQTFAAFQIRTTTVTQAVVATITATSVGQNKTATLTVTP